MIRQPFEPDPDKTGAGKRESHCPATVEYDVGTSLKPYSLATLGGRCEYGFFMMKIRINGEEKEVTAGLSIANLLEQLQIRPARVVIELNRNIVSRQAHSSTLLKDGDAVEIVQFVGGG